MPAHVAWGSAFVLAVVLCAVRGTSQGQDCSTEKMENTTVDIRAALPKGIRGTDPVHTASWEACVNVCCSGKEVADKKKCNLVVFSAKRKGSYPNCYLFYYPNKESLPMNQGVGLMTARIVTDADVLKPAPASNRLSHFMGNGSSVPVHTPTKLPSRSGSLPKPTGSKTEENVNPTKKPNSKTDGYSQHAKGDGVKQSKSSDALLMHEVSRLLPPNVSSTVKHIVPNPQPTVKMPPLPSGTVASPTLAATTKSATAYHRNTLAATEPRKSPTASRPATTSETSSTNLHLLPSSAPDIFVSVPLPDLSGTKLEPELADSAGISGEEHPPSFGGKNILFATLLFGVMFLLLVTVQMGRKMLQSLQQKRYTRLDYLINGMYANM